MSDSLTRAFCLQIPMAHRINRDEVTFLRGADSGTALKEFESHAHRILAAEIEAATASLRAENERLRRALAPFAGVKVAAHWPAQRVVTFCIRRFFVRIGEPYQVIPDCADHDEASSAPTVGDYRRALEAMRDA